MSLEICKFANERIKIGKRDFETSSPKDFVLLKTEKVQQKNLTISQYSFTKIKEETKLQQI
ncbi:hypothetical protein [Flavobacterium nackdongense]|uniref:Uncharacterized protein n=1 Tax=Flavobacterium nackdongense TaxID=2547394 RepID=A0A4P6Y7H6_9FLAO|nr:hypothetical protein [Flavobacterium nackdongense]QBN18591.1 hypothetical protein E1750_07125 [Flavobacterium nackdongense]